jgi:hypothetical protein
MRNSQTTYFALDFSFGADFPITFVWVFVVPAGLVRVDG